MSRYVRDGVTGGDSTHTEYTRLLAEHGVLGLLAAGLLIVMAVGAYRSALGDWNRLLTVALVVWAAVTMSHSATRTASVAFCFALANLRAAPDDQDVAPAGTQAGAASPRSVQV